jgi:hypothetical protein
MNKETYINAWRKEIIISIINYRRESVDGRIRDWATNEVAVILEKGQSQVATLDYALATYNFGKSRAEGGEVGEVTVVFNSLDAALGYRSFHGGCGNGVVVALVGQASHRGETTSTGQIVRTDRNGIEEHSTY